MFTLPTTASVNQLNVFKFLAQALSKYGTIVSSFFTQMSFLMSI